MENDTRTHRTGRPSLTLALETSSRIGSVALASGDHLLDESTFSSPMLHSTEIFPAIDGLLTRHGHKPQDLDQIHIAIGPGSFTGLRIAVATAKTMHLAQGVQIVAVNSLDVVAANLADASGTGDRPIPDRIAALFDAKRGQFYAAIYDRAPRDPPPDPGRQDPGYRIPAPGDAAWRKTQPDALMTAQEIIAAFAGDGPLGVLGDGLLYHREQFIGGSVVVLPQHYWSPSAANVHRLGRQKALAGRFEDPLTLAPFYLRGPQVTVKKKP